MLSSMRNRSLFFFFLVTLENFCSVSCLIQLSRDNPRSMKVKEEGRKGIEDKEELEIKINYIRKNKSKRELKIKRSRKRRNRKENRKEEVEERRERGRSRRCEILSWQWVETSPFQEGFCLFYTHYSHNRDLPSIGISLLQKLNLAHTQKSRLNHHPPKKGSHWGRFCISIPQGKHPFISD